jgi:hypothetical protein
MRTAQHTDVEDALFQWFKNVCDQNIPISGSTLAAKADDLAIRLGHTDFTANHNWVERFKQRRGIESRSINGESAAVEETVVEDYVSTTLPNLLRDYDPKDVLSMDKTGLFYKLLPNRTLQFKGERSNGGKQSKERLTVVSVNYDANKKAWMTSSIFEQWIKDIDRSMTRQKRKILLFVDNCPAHPHIPEFQVCHSTVPATKHNFKHTTDGPGYRHELQAELPSPSNFKVDRQP